MKTTKISVGFLENLLKLEAFQTGNIFVGEGLTAKLETYFYDEEKEDDFDCIIQDGDELIFIDLDGEEVINIRIVKEGSFLIFKTKIKGKEVDYSIFSKYAEKGKLIEYIAIEYGLTLIVDHIPAVIFEGAITLSITKNRISKHNNLLSMISVLGKIVINQESVPSEDSMIHTESIVLDIEREIKKISVIFRKGNTYINFETNSGVKYRLVDDMGFSRREEVEQVINNVKKRLKAFNVIKNIATKIRA